MLLQNSSSQPALPGIAGPRSNPGKNMEQLFLSLPSPNPEKACSQDSPARLDLKVM